MQLRHFVEDWYLQSCQTRLELFGTDTDMNEYYEALRCFTRKCVCYWPFVLAEEDNKPWECVKLMVGDNCSVNRSIGSREGRDSKAAARREVDAFRAAACTPFR